MKTWELYFLKRLTSLFLLILICFFALYALIDYSSRSGFYQSLSLTPLQILYYYLCVFATRIEILLPFALLVSAVGTLCSLNIRNEFVALMSSGLSKWRILRPFFNFSLLMVALLYLNGELIVPSAIHRIQSLQGTKYHSFLGADRNIFSISLSQGETLLFHNYDNVSEKLSDVWWLQKDGGILQMESLSPFSTPPVGENAYQLAKIDGKIQLEQHKKMLTLPDFSLDPDTFRKQLIPTEQMPLYLLWQNKAGKGRSAETDTLWFRKLLSPWLPLFVILLSAPFCLRFTRNLPTFMIFVFSVVVLISFYLVLNAMHIISESGALPPYLGMGIPFLLLLIGGIWSIYYLQWER